VADAKTVALITESNRGMGFETARQLGHARPYRQKENETADFTRKLQEAGH
jgi:hypothetical protein